MHTPELDGILENEEQREQHRHRQEHGETSHDGAERTHAVLLVKLDERFALFLRVFLVPLLHFGQLRLDALHLETGAHRALVQGPEQKAHGDTEDDQHPTVRHIERLPDPEQNAHADRRERLNARDPATVRIDVLELVPN